MRVEERFIRRVRQPYGEQHTHQECTGCGKVHPLADFHRNNKNPSGRATACKRCNRMKYGFGEYKGNAKWRGIAFSLTKKQCDVLMNLPCHYCGQPPDPVNGIDRVDNDQGYTPENCVPCCRLCNIAKNKNSAEVFKAWIKRAYEYQERQGWERESPCPKERKRKRQHLLSAWGVRESLLEIG